MCQSSDRSKLGNSESTFLLIVCVCVSRDGVLTLSMITLIYVNTVQSCHQTCTFGAICTCSIPAIEMCEVPDFCRYGFLCKHGWVQSCGIAVPPIANWTLQLRLRDVAAAPDHCSVSSSEGMLLERIFRWGQLACLLVSCGGKHVAQFIK